MHRIKPISENDSRLIYLPLHEMTEVRGTYKVLENLFWVIHSTRGLVFFDPTRGKLGLEGAYPQANPKELTARRIASILYPWAFVELINRVFVPQLGDTDE